MKWLAVSFVRTGKLLKRYERHEFVVTADTVDKAQDEAVEALKRLYSGRVYFLARLYEMHT